MSSNYIDKNIYIPVLSPGDKIYHYTSVAGLKGIVGKEFWVTEQHFLNDSTEFQIGTEVFVDVLKKHILNEKVLERFETRLREEMNEIYRMGRLEEELAFSGEYVISFCLDEDSTLMWSEYSDFMGYCMKFDFQKLLDSFPDRHIFHGKVVYDHEEQLQCIERTFENEIFKYPEFAYASSWEDLNHLKDTEIEDLVQYSSVICDIYNMFFKKSCFAGEYEYRFVFSCGHDGGKYRKEELVPLHFRIKDEVLIPYVKKSVSDLDSLEAVLVGPKNKSDIAVKGLEYFFRNEKLDIEVRKSAMPLRY